MIKPDDHSWLLSRLTVGGLGSEPLAEGVPTRCLAGPFMAGDSREMVACSFGVSIRAVEDAIRIEMALARRHKWAVQWRDELAAEAEKKLRKALRNLKIKQAKKPRGRAASKV